MGNQCGEGCEVQNKNVLLRCQSASLARRQALPLQPPASCFTPDIRPAHRPPPGPQDLECSGSSCAGGWVDAARKWVSGVGNRVRGNEAWGW